jgi:hypothetical protein
MIVWECEIKTPNGVADVLEIITHKLLQGSKSRGVE